MHGINLHFQTEEMYPFITKLLAFVIVKLAAMQRFYHVLRLLACKMTKLMFRALEIDTIYI